MYDRPDSYLWGRQYICSLDLTCNTQANLFVQKQTNCGLRRSITTTAIPALHPSRISVYTGNINTLRPKQNGRHFADNIFKGIFMNENIYIWINISLKFILRDPLNNIPSLIQIMAWPRPGEKTLSEPMMIKLPTQICVTRPQWVKPCIHIIVNV